MSSQLIGYMTNVRSLEGLNGWSEISSARQQGGGHGRADSRSLTARVMAATLPAGLPEDRQCEWRCQEVGQLRSNAISSSTAREHASLPTP